MSRPRPINLEKFMKCFKYKKIMDEKITNGCPLCQSQLTYCVWNETRLMISCINVECPFPFNEMRIKPGSVNLEKIKDDRSFEDDQPLRHDKFKVQVNHIKQELTKIAEHSKQQNQMSENREKELFDSLSFENSMTKLTDVVKLNDRPIPASFPKMCPECESTLNFAPLTLEKVCLYCINQKCTFPLDCMKFSNTVVEREQLSYITGRASTMKIELAALSERAESQLNKLNEKIERQKSLETRLMEMRKLSSAIEKRKVTQNSKTTKSAPVIRNENLLRKLADIQSISKEKMMLPEEEVLINRTESANINVVREDGGGVPAFRVEFVGGAP